MLWSSPTTGNRAHDRTGLGSISAAHDIPNAAANNGALKRVITTIVIIVVVVIIIVVILVIVFVILAVVVLVFVFVFRICRARQC